MRRAKVWFVAVLVVCLVLGGLLTALWFAQRRLIYFPDAAAPPPIPGAREVRLHTTDGLELGASFVPARGPSRGVTVLVANGNAGNRSARAPLASALAERGIAVLLFDYRGYGGNAGSPTEQGLALDVRAAHRFLTDEEGVRPDRLLYFGESLGAAVVTELAVEHPPAGLLLRSPFVDLASAGRVHYPFLPVGALLRDRYPVAEHAAKVAVPTTVVYGTADAVIPPEQSRVVAEAAGAEQVAVPDADHNDQVLLDGTALIAAVVELAPN